MCEKTVKTEIFVVFWTESTKSASLMVGESIASSNTELGFRELEIKGDIEKRRAVFHRKQNLLNVKEVGFDIDSLLL